MGWLLDERVFSLQRRFVTFLREHDAVDRRFGHGDLGELVRGRLPVPRNTDGVVNRRNSVPALLSTSSTRELL